MKLRNPNTFLGEIDTFDPRALAGHGLREDAATAAHIEHVLARERMEAIDPSQTKRVDLMKGFEFAGRIPPAACKGAELLEFGGIGVG